MTTRYLNYKHAAAYLDMPEGTLRSMVDEITPRVDLFELEHRHALTEIKMAALRDLGARLAAAGWAMRLFGAATSSSGWTEIDVETGALAVDEIARMVRSNHVRFEVP